jgi:hypothetical protein
MVHSQRQRQESSDIVDVDELVPDGMRLSERDGARERR